MNKSTRNFKEAIIERFDWLEEDSFDSGWTCSFYDDPTPPHTSAWSITLKCKEDKPTGDRDQRRVVMVNVTYYPPGDPVFEDGAVIIKTRSDFTNYHGHLFEDVIRGLDVSSRNVYKRLKKNVDDAIYDPKLETLGLGIFPRSNPSKGTSVLGALILGGIIGHSMKK